MRYATENNFTGKIVPGYERNICIITLKAAKILKELNDELNQYGMNLKIFDAYRPKNAAKSFIDWAYSKEDNLDLKKIYYPNINRSDSIGNYIADTLSTHSRGSTVDLTIIDLKTNQELEMGGIFDLFDEISHTATPNIPDIAKKNRLLLKSIMEKFGFKNLWKEWWHYTLIDEPFKDQYFDFMVK
ncbi:peptidase M15 [Candidatus Aquarickettsia rohweri]|uniref:D-alanyl-D-alanine dipeptidase n=2 Tax=Candidatus Aquarickettsia rohweri TaxID=2602574 RepID=A0A429XFE7_9RICK|nr:peptidase M15 [Candidatus Aquarickettsia rohweri]